VNPPQRVLVPERDDWFLRLEIDNERGGLGFYHRQNCMAQSTAESLILREGKGASGAVCGLWGAKMDCMECGHTRLTLPAAS